MSVFVSGATGFVAQHIINHLLNQNYKVIGSVRTQAKADALLHDFNNPNLSLEIVPDISVLDAFDDVFKKRGKEIKYVIHVATGSAFETDDYDKGIIIPAVNGTKGILESIKKYAPEAVERFVYTSSIVAMRSSMEKMFDETSWNVIERKDISDPFTAYMYSKKLAEQEVWNFLKANKDSVRFTVTTVNPSLIIGPQLFDKNVSSTLNFSNDFINRVIHAAPDATNINPMSDSFINVEDVAKAHILAMQKDELINKRLLVVNKMYTDQDILDILNEDFPVLKGKIPVGKPGTGNIAANNGAAQMNDDATRKLLKFEYISFKDTVDSVTEQILKHEGRL